MRRLSKRKQELKFCDEYQQDLLHIIESFATSGSESASIMSKLRQNRVRRRAIKDRQNMNQKSAAALQQLKKVVHAFPTDLSTNTPTYILKTSDGLQLVDTLDAERKRTHVTFHYIEPKNTEQTQKLTKQEGPFHQKVRVLFVHHQVPQRSISRAIKKAGNSLKMMKRFSSPIKKCKK